MFDNKSAGNNACPQKEHVNTKADFSRSETNDGPMPPKPEPDHLRDGHQMATHILATYTLSQQNEMLRYIHDSIVNQRRSDLEELHRRITIVEESLNEL